MAKFLTTTGISYRLEEIIKTAEERLVLISPFLRVNERIKELLEDKDRLKMDVRVIYGKNQLQPEENNWLESMASIRTSYCKNLHAKCYLNENEALLTSMNLYEFSQVNNNEMGILISREEEPALYGEVWKEAQRIVRVSVGEPVEPPEDEEDDDDEECPPDLEPPQSGFCIRCKASIALNPARPYCKRCFRSWNIHKNKEYEESYCHICGEEHKTTMSKPACRNCYHKYSSVLEFAPS